MMETFSEGMDAQQIAKERQHVRPAKIIKTLLAKIPRTAMIAKLPTIPNPTNPVVQRILTSRTALLWIRRAKRLLLPRARQHLLLVTTYLSQRSRLLLLHQLNFLEVGLHSHFLDLSNGYLMP